MVGVAGWPDGRGRGQWLGGRVLVGWPWPVAVAVAGGWPWPGWPWPPGRSGVAGWPWPWPGGRGRVAVGGPWPWPVWPATKKKRLCTTSGPTSSDKKLRRPSGSASKEITTQKKPMKITSLKGVSRILFDGDFCRFRR